MFALKCGNSKCSKKKEKIAMCKKRMRKVLVNKLYGEEDHLKEDMVTYPMQVSSYVGCSGVYIYYVIHSYRNLLVQANMRNE